MIYEQCDCPVHADQTGPPSGFDYNQLTVCREDPDTGDNAGRRVLAQLASQLANGTKFEPGDVMPLGWTSSRRRIFVKVTREMLALVSGSKYKA
jgi:hypothetical protein